MSDLLERLTAANPVPDADRPSIDEVWRKISALDDARQPTRRRPWWRAPSGSGRAALTLAAVLVPIVVVLAVAIPLHSSRHSSTRPRSSAAGNGRPTLDPAAQRLAGRELAGRRGSVVALDPRTGAIKVMCTTIAKGGCGPASSALADHARYPPGATVDIVTAAAALDTGRYTPSSRFGSLTLDQALSISADSVFAQVADQVGQPTMTTYMRRFGLSSARATPLQMASVAAAVADGGTLVGAHLVSGAPALGQRVMKASTARALTAMMRGVVQHGTATPADVAGLQIAGKTATAHVGAPGSRRTQLWFIGFAPAAHPRIAIAVTLSDARGGFGGTEAGPIAARVIGRLLGDGAQGAGAR